MDFQQYDIFINTCLVSLSNEPLSVFNGHNLIVGKVIYVNVYQPYKVGKDKLLNIPTNTIRLKDAVENSDVAPHMRWHQYLSSDKMARSASPTEIL